MSLAAIAATALATNGGSFGIASTSKSGSLCPKVSQASLNLDTLGCPTALSNAVAEARTSWKIDKTAETGSLLNPDATPILYTVKVTEGPTNNVLVATGQIIMTNGGQQIPVLSSVVANLQNSPQHANVSTAVAVKDAACRDGQGVEGGQTCFGQFQNSPGASLTLTDTSGNDVTALLGTVPIPPSTDCSGAVVLNFKAEFDLSQAGLSPGDAARVEILTTFAGAGGRGKSSDDVSCTADANCNGAIDGDNPNTCQLNESESNNVRTVKWRASITIPQLTPVCPSVTKTDQGAYPLDQSCVSVSSSSLNDSINAQGAGSMTTQQVSGTVSCGSSACGTDVTNTATIFCADGRNELIEGSPASASFPVVCEKKGKEISVGDFCTATQGCWGQPRGGFCAGVRDNQFSSLVSAFAANFGLTSPGGVLIGDISGGLNGSPGGFAARWDSGAAVESYLPAGDPAGTLTTELLNPTETSSNVLDGQLLAATLNKARDDAGLFQKNSTEKLANLVLQACQGFAIAPSLQGLTVKQLICVADKAASGTVGCSGTSIPSCAIAVNPPDCQLSSPVQATLSELVEALDAVNSNFDDCTANLGCLALP